MAIATRVLAAIPSLTLPAEAGCCGSTLAPINDMPASEAVLRWGGKFICKTNEILWSKIGDHEHIHTSSFTAAVILTAPTVAVSGVWASVDSTSISRSLSSPVSCALSSSESTRGSGSPESTMKRTVSELQNVSTYSDKGKILLHA